MTSKEIWAIDCETDPFQFDRVPEPCIWGAKKLYANDYEEFDTTEDFLFWAKQKDAIFYAHNGGKFDWQFITHEIPAYTKLMLINGRYSKFKIGDAEFRDSWNILPIPLADFRKTEFEYWKLERDVREEHMPEIKAYLADDCHDLGELIEAFINTHGVQLTQAGAAMKYWQKMSGRKADQTTSTYFEEFSQYYFGGRVECFEKGVIEREFVVADINSAYPFAMQFLHPSSNFTERDNEIPEDDEEIARSFIDMDAVSTGAFPFRDEDGSLTFPCDQKVRRFKISGWEYLAARDTETLHVKNVHEVITFQRTISFKDYVHDLYEKRKEAKRGNDKARDILYKLLLNSLYRVREIWS